MVWYPAVVLGAQRIVPERTYDLRMNRGNVIYSPYSKISAIMVEVRRRDNETVGAMLRRFTRRVQLSGILLNSRRRRFYVSPSTRRQVRERALRRAKVAKERERLEKMGKFLKEE